MDDAANAVRDAEGNVNRAIDPQRTGRHLWRFTFPAPLNLGEPLRVNWAATPNLASVPLVPGKFFYQLKTDLPLGTLVRGSQTMFRLFAPRALQVQLHVFQNLDKPLDATVRELTRREDDEGAAGVWEAALDQDLANAFANGYVQRVSSVGRRAKNGIES